MNVVESSKLHELEFNLARIWLEWLTISSFCRLIVFHSINMKCTVKWTILGKLKVLSFKVLN